MLLKNRFPRTFPFQFSPPKPKFKQALIVVVVGLSLYHFAGDPPTWIYLTVVASIVVLFTPVLFRYARGLMLYLFGSVAYDPKYRNQ